MNVDNRFFHDGGDVIRRELINNGCHHDHDRQEWMSLCQIAKRSGVVCWFTKLSDPVLFHGIGGPQELKDGANVRLSSDHHTPRALPTPPSTARQSKARSQELGVGMATTGSLGRIAVQSLDWRNRRFPDHTGAIRAASACARRGRTRRPGCRNLSGSRGRGAAVPRPGLHALPGAANARPLQEERGVAGLISRFAVASGRRLLHIQRPRVRLSSSFSSSSSSCPAPSPPSPPAPSAASGSSPTSPADRRCGCRPADPAPSPPRR